MENMENMENLYKYTVIVNCIDEEHQTEYQIHVQLLYEDNDLDVLMYAYERYCHIQDDFEKYHLRKSKNTEINSFHGVLADRILDYVESFN